MPPLAPPGGQVPEFLKAQATQGAWNFHHTLAEYAPTPLVGLAGLARELGVGAVFVKDESHRFGLNAFKALGGSTPSPGPSAGNWVWGEFDLRPALRPGVPGEGAGHGVRHHHRRQPRPGRGLGRPQAGVPGPRVSPRRLFSPARAQAILDVGAAEATILDLGYDDAVRYAARMAWEKGWYLIQDTSWPGYEDVPAWIVQGYTTLAREAADQLAQAGLLPGPPMSFSDGGPGKIHALRLICQRHTPANMAEFDEAIRRSLPRTAIWRIEIREITGKRKKFDAQGQEMKFGRME